MPAQALETGSWIAGIGSFFLALVSLWLSSRSARRQNKQEPTIAVKDLKEILLEARESSVADEATRGDNEQRKGAGETPAASGSPQDPEDLASYGAYARYGDIAWWDDRIDNKRAKYEYKPRSNADTRRLLLVAAVCGVVAALGFAVNLLSGVFL